MGFIKRTGKPYLWPGHTHTKPPPGSKPVYLDEFELPKKFRAPDRRSPCPCCTPGHPKFCDGKIAWFPSEGVIRILGPDCFKGLDAQGHEDALVQMRADRRRDKDTHFLLTRLPGLSKIIAVGETATRVADALQEFHRDLHGRLQLARLNLWRDVQRDGELRVTQKTREIRRGRNLEEYFVDAEAEVVAFRLDGYEVLNPDLRIGTAALKGAVRKLKGFVGLSARSDAIDQINDAARHEAAGEIGHAITAIRTAVKNLARWQRFATPLAINSLKNWGMHEGCRTRCYYSFSEDRLNFGPNEDRPYSVQISSDLFLKIGNPDL